MIKQTKKKKKLVYPQGLEETKLSDLATTEEINENEHDKDITGNSNYGHKHH
jgi:hypothetical protein